MLRFMAFYVFIWREAWRLNYSCFLAFLLTINVTFDMMMAVRAQREVFRQCENLAQNFYFFTQEQDFGIFITILGSHRCSLHSSNLQMSYAA